MVQANHHSKSKHLTSDRPLKNGTILNQNVKTVIIGMAFCFPSLVFKPPLHVEKRGSANRLCLSRAGVATLFVLRAEKWAGRKMGLKSLGAQKCVKISLAGKI